MADDKKEVDIPIKEQEDGTVLAKVADLPISQSDKNALIGGV